MNPTSSNTLLTYSLTTLPNPLQVSPETGGSVSSDITIVISNDSGDGALQLTQVTFLMPIGLDAADLTNDQFSYSASPSAVWTVNPAGSAGEFILTPVNGQPVTVTTDGIVVQFFGIHVNQKVGTFPLDANELAQGTGNPKQLRQAHFEVAKFPYGYFFGQFAASAPQVNDGQPVTLTWSGSDLSTYTMFWGNEQAVVTNVRSWTSPPLTMDTTFKLVATSTSQGETVHTSLSTTVIVANPEVKATSLQVTGVSNLQGNTTVGGDLNFSKSLSGGTASFTNASATSLSGNSLNIQGNATVTSLNVNGPATITGKGNATFGALNSDSLNVSGNTVLAGPVQLIGPLGHSYGTGTFTATTDMLITANVSHGAVKNNEDKSYAVVGIGTEGQWIWASGGNVAGPDKTYLSTNGACTMFVRKGQQYSLQVKQDSKNKVAAYWEFYKWNLGSSSSIPRVAESGEKSGGKVVGDATSAVFEPDLDAIAKDIMNSVKKGDEKKLAGILKMLLRKQD